MQLELSFVLWHFYCFVFFKARVSLGSSNWTQIQDPPASAYCMHTGIYYVTPQPHLIHLEYYLFTWVLWRGDD